MSKQTRNLVLAGLFMALGLVLPFFTAQIPSIGRALLPMHIPVLLAGFVCGWPLGLVVGFVTPLLRTVLFGMPPLFPTALAMAFELAAYGFLAGYFYRLLSKKDGNVVFTLIIAMLGGRIVWGIVSLLLYGLSGTSFGWQMFLGGAFFNAIPGIFLQLFLIPAVVLALKRGNFMK